MHEKEKGFPRLRIEHENPHAHEAGQPFVNWSLDPREEVLTRPLCTSMGVRISSVIGGLERRFTFRN